MATSCGRARSMGPLYPRAPQGPTKHATAGTLGATRVCALPTLTISERGPYSDGRLGARSRHRLPTTDEIRQFEARLAREPTSQAYAALAEAYRRAGRADEAVTLCREGLMRHPGYVTTRLVLAKALLEVGDVQAARVEIQRFLGGEPDHEPALRIAVECALRGGDPVGALEHVRRLAGLDPHDRAVQGLSRALE